MQHTNSLIGDSEVMEPRNPLFPRSFRLVARIPCVNLTESRCASLPSVCPSPRNCTRVPYHESRKNLLRAVLAFLRPCRLRSLITAISCQVGLRKVCKVQEVCERIFTCNCLVNDGLAMLKQAERTRQLELGSDFQIRRNNETHD
jgi:hypothetical protein